MGAAVAYDFSAKVNQHSAPSGVADATSPASFNDRVSNLLDRIDCRVAVTAEDREAIFHLRYNAYLNEGAIAPNSAQRFSDPYDHTDNVRIFGLYLDGQLASSIRLHVANKAQPEFPSHKVFADLMDPELEAGKTIIDPTRFATDKRLSKLFPGLPYVTLRLCWLAAEHFNAEHFLVAIRPEHQAFYRRTFLHQPICEARPYPLLAKPISLMTSNYEDVADAVHRRYPFFRSTYFERRMLFGLPTRPETVAGPRLAVI
jgi:hypothetical protein